MASEIDDFLNHRTNDFERANMLKSWKDVGEIDTWMHTQRQPKPVWRHQIPKLVIVEDKETKESNIMLWSDNIVCHEPEDVLRKLNQRDDNDERKVPPTVCGVCKLEEWIRREIRESRINWVAPIFHFKGKTRDDKGDLKDVETVLFSGGLVGAYKDVDDDDEKKELRKAGVYLKEAWKQAIKVKCSYIMCVVDNAKPKDGVQVSVETSLLGDKVRGVISDRIVVKGKEVGNPLITPYAIKWKYNDKEREFHKKYHAIAMTEIELTKVIKDLIFSANPPKIDYLSEPYEQATVRAFLERHTVYQSKDNPIPWDNLFPKGRHSPTSTSTTKSSKSDEDDKPAETKKESTGIKLPGMEPDEEPVECDKCAAPMRMCWSSCPKCGAKYTGDDLIEPPKVEIVKRTRKLAEEPSEKKVEAKSEEKPTTAKKAEAKSKKKDEEEDEDDEDHIPF